ncbi:Helix-turn-helix domain containing protein [Taylorella asinigenitalis MCE3]|uniref:Helix-turn-helix domain containing protein n=2 Tax=Taylorella asinigenitalis TaxID=84590 RepID=G4QCR1_TAYAM|nr:Helix-turn-helix domain containing protein [Taylorella asinigenitalis MCE3]
MIFMNKDELRVLLSEAALEGGKKAVENLKLFTKSQACELLNISTPTLMKRIKAGKIKTVDGYISGAELLKYIEGNNVTD